MVTKMPNNGRGVYRRISEYLGVSSVLISQIFKGPKDISVEQGFKLSEFLGFLALEKKFFINLIHYSKSGTHDLKEYYNIELKYIREQAKAIENRVSHTNLLTETDKSIFYSDWKYSAIRLACEMESVNDIDDLKILFSQPQLELKKYIEFLKKTGLINVNAGKFELGPSSTHLSKASPYIKSHHRNWRLKSLESIDNMDSDEIMYTAPMGVSKELFKELNQKILKFIDEFVESASTDQSVDGLFYLNIDLKRM